jgi:selenium metabolism protein YedF
MVLKGEPYMSEIDCRGMACPLPVVTAKQALDKIPEGEVTLLLNDPVSRENVERFGRSQGHQVRTEDRGQDFVVRITKTPAPGGEPPEAAVPAGQKGVVYINSRFLGVGDDALGTVLMRAFLKTLLELSPRPGRLLLINSGVQLACEGSEVLDSLESLAGMGTEVLACGTCLDFYGLKEKLRVGAVTNMYVIAQSLLDTDRLIRP